MFALISRKTHKFWIYTKDGRTSGSLLSRCIGILILEGNPFELLSQRIYSSGEARLKPCPTST